MAAWTLRAAIALVPLALGAGAGLLAGSLLPRPDGSPEALGWWLVVAAASTVVIAATDVIARRAIPLSLLLRLSFVFPDRAPSRFGLALRARSPASLRRWAHEQGPPGEGVREQAERALALVASLNAHDRRTRGHSDRVRVLSVLLAEEMGVARREIELLEWAALLHDIGKLEVPESLLNKQGRPDEREWALLTRHPGAGATLAEPVAGWLGPWRHCIDGHHERWDGTGYPDGLAGEAIPFSARLVAVTDAFETMTAVRSYKPPMSIEAARSELVASAGSHFDPAVVRAFLRISLPRLGLVLGPLVWLAQLPYGMRLIRGVDAGARVGPVASRAAAGLSAAALAGLLVTGDPGLPTAPAGPPGEVAAAPEAEGRGSDSAAPPPRTQAAGVTAGAASTEAPASDGTTTPAGETASPSVDPTSPAPDTAAPADAPGVRVTVDVATTRTQLAVVPDEPPVSFDPNGASGDPPIAIGVVTPSGM